MAYPWLNQPSPFFCILITKALLLSANPSRYIRVITFGLIYSSDHNGYVIGRECGMAHSLRQAWIY